MFIYEVFVGEDRDEWDKGTYMIEFVENFRFFIDPLHFLLTTLEFLDDFHSHFLTCDLIVSTNHSSECTYETIIDVWLFLSEKISYLRRSFHQSMNTIHGDQFDRCLSDMM